VVYFLRTPVFLKLPQLCFFFFFFFFSVFYAFLKLFFVRSPSACRALRKFSVFFLFDLFRFFTVAALDSDLWASPVLLDFVILPKFFFSVTALFFFRPFQ